MLNIILFKSPGVYYYNIQHFCARTYIGGVLSFSSSLNYELFRATVRSDGPRSISFHYLYPKVIQGDTMHIYFTGDVCPTGCSADVARSNEACINLKCITTPVWHRGIFPEFVNLELKWLVSTEVPFLSVASSIRRILKFYPLPSSVMYFSLSHKCTRRRRIFHSLD